jgi:hypothetical protein
MSKGLVVLLRPLSGLGRRAGDHLGPHYEHAGRMPVAVLSRCRAFPHLAVVICVIGFLAAIPSAHSIPATSWHGVLRDSAGSPISNATVRLRATTGILEFTATSSANGEFSFAEIAAGSYEISVNAAGQTWKAANPLVLQEEPR